MASTSFLSTQTRRFGLIGSAPLPRDASRGVVLFLYCILPVFSPPALCPTCLCGIFQPLACYNIERSIPGQREKLRHAACDTRRTTPVPFPPASPMMTPTGAASEPPFRPAQHENDLSSHEAVFFFCALQGEERGEANNTSLHICHRSTTSSAREGPIRPGGIVCHRHCDAAVAGPRLRAQSGRGRARSSWRTETVVAASAFAGAVAVFL